jgi:hypothetical protein
MSMAAVIISGVLFILSLKDEYGAIIVPAFFMHHIDAMRVKATRRGILLIALVRPMPLWLLQYFLSEHYSSCFPI